MSNRPARRAERVNDSRNPSRRLLLEPLEDRRLLAFLAPVVYPAGAGAMQIFSADFNNDDAADLAVLNFNNSVSLLLNNGDGTFQPPVSYGIGGIGRPVSLAVGDLDGDGNMDDLAIASYGNGYGYGHFDNADVRILTFADDGTLQTASSPFAGNGRAASVAVGDFNCDGKMDLAVPVNEYYYHSGGWLSSVNVLLGTGGGGFSAPNSTFLGRPLGSALAFNGNGLMVLATNWQSGGYDILYFQGISSSGILQFYGVGHTDGGLTGYVLGDFTGDGIGDLIDNGNLFYGLSDGTYSSPEPIGVWGGAAGDFNGDGWLDLAAFANGGVSVLINDQSWAGPRPTLNIRDAIVTEGHSGTVAAGFEVTLSSDPSEPVTVSYTTADFSATTADGDYQSKSGTLTFSPGGPLTQTISVLVNGDRRGEIGDQFFVTIASADAPVIDGQAIGTIIEDEPTLYLLSSPSVIEGNSGTTPLGFTLTLSAPYDVPITVSFATQDGSAMSADGDYQAASGTATFAAGAATTTVTINVKGDQKVEEDETFLVKLSNAPSAYIPDQGLATGIIRNDDDATKFYVVDASSERTYEYDRNGAPVENYHLAWGNDDPRGAASDASGQRVWVIDNDDYVDVYDAAGNSLGYWKAKGLSTPEGIASNGTDIWIVDRGSDRVYRYAGAANRTSGSMSPTSSFSLNSGNRDAKGIETDGTHLWVVNDASTNKVFKYTLFGTLVGSWTINGSNTSPTGITLDPASPSDVWIVDSSRDQVFQYTAAAGRTHGSQSPSAVFNLAPGNSNPQGIADPPPPADQAASLTTTVSNADARSATPNLGLLLEVAASTAAERRGRNSLIRPSNEIGLLVPRRPAVSSDSTIQTSSLGELAGEVLRRPNEENDEYFHRKALDAHELVFADIERLGNILRDDKR
jgi:hypothetical protein